jgi:hypothetical protein
VRNAHHLTRHKISDGWRESASLGIEGGISSKLAWLAETDGNRWMISVILKVIKAILQ